MTDRLIGPLLMLGAFALSLGLVWILERVERIRRARADKQHLDAQHDWRERSPEVSQDP